MLAVDESKLDNIQFNPSEEAKEVLKAFKAKKRIPVRAVMNRLVNWFGKQPRDIQMAVLGLGAEPPDAGKIVWEQEE